LKPLPPPAIRMEILSQAGLLAPVRAMLTSFSERSGFDDIETGHLALAVDEALANVIRHGYDSQPDGRIWISAYLIEEPQRRIRIEIEDEGRQTDPDRIVSRDLDEVRPGGLGVHIMREVTDTCEFERRKPGGMRLILEKTPRGEQKNLSDQNHTGTPENGSK
jgi:anti-sigma regulatory factor (Ser/Thr protein kinase)